jgi:hypothetical protein
MFALLECKSVFGFWASAASLVTLSVPIDNPPLRSPIANNIKVSNPKAINPRVSYFGIVEYIIYNQLLVGPNRRVGFNFSP